MFGRTPARPSATGDIGISAADAANLRHRTVRLPGVVDSSPIFLHDVRAGGGGRGVFLMNTTYGRVVAVDAKTAKIVWTFTPRGIDGWKGSYRITNATPTVSGDRRFVSSGSPDGRVHKLSISDGAEQGAAGPCASPSSRRARRSRPGSASSAGVSSSAPVATSATRRPTRATSSPSIRAAAASSG